MTYNRTKNAKRNIINGLMLKIYQMLCPFITRTVMIHILGMEYVGINGLFTSILQVLNLAELGVGSALTFSMYKPIAEKDYNTVCKLMNLYRHYYRIIGTVILILGLSLTPFLRLLIKNDVPHDINVIVLYVMNLIATVLSYWLFAYKSCVLMADQRADIVSKISLLTTTIQYFLQIIFLAFFKNYYLFVLSILIAQVTNNLISSKYVDDNYEYMPKGNLEEDELKEINVKIKDLLTNKIGGTIINSADSIVISAFLGLTILAKYNNYFYILNSVLGVITIIFSAITASIGNSIITERKEKNLDDFFVFSFIISWLSCVTSACLIGLYQPFMEVWVGVNNMFTNNIMICFVIYYHVQVINRIFVTYKDAAGIWHEDRFRPLVVSIANLTLNLLTVNIWGIYGVLLSTIATTLLIGMPWLLKTLFSTLFDGKCIGYLKQMLLYQMVTVISVLLVYFLNKIMPIKGLCALLVGACISVVVPNIILIVVFRKSQIFNRTILFAEKFIGKKPCDFIRKILFIKKNIL